MLDDRTRTTGSDSECVGCDAVNLAGADGGDVDVVEFFWRSAGGDLGAVCVSHSCELLHSPTLGHVAEGGGDARELGVSARLRQNFGGDSELDKPLAVDGAGHRLQELHAPLTVPH